MSAESAAVRASVERGDPLAIFSVAEGFPIPGAPGMAPGLYARFRDGSTHLIEPATIANGLKPDPPQPVTADPQSLDAEADGNYSHGVFPHPVKFAPDGEAALAGEAIGAGWTEETRLAFLARVQRIDPRERKP